MKSNNFKYSAITEKIIKETFYVYNQLCSGFLEKVYENALILRLKKMFPNIQSQYPIKIFFEEELIGEYIADIVVESKVIIEIKAIKKLLPIHEVQLVNYLKATKMEVGLLLNFGDKMEIKRKVYSSSFRVNHNQSEQISVKRKVKK